MKQMNYFTNLIKVSVKTNANIKQTFSLGLIKYKLSLLKLSSIN